MATEAVHACVDRTLPEDQWEKAAEEAVAENPANAPDGAVAFAGNALPPGFMALLTGKRWRPGRTLRIRFLDGPDVIRQKVRQVAEQWLKHANLKFQFGDDAAAEIRIALQPGAGSWSYLGTDALTIPRDQPTMNFGWLEPGTPDEEYSRVVLHEFGHALACVHEHQNPQGGIRWNKDAVYRSLMGSPNFWSKEQVDSNMFKRYSRSISNSTAFDPESIMLYSFPREWTTDGFQAKLNSQLSVRDIQFIRMNYPTNS